MSYGNPPCKLEVAFLRNHPPTAVHHSHEIIYHPSSLIVNTFKAQKYLHDKPSHFFTYGKGRLISHQVG